jgi:RNA polymerase sigma factor (sigma-70 family)
MSSSTFDFDSAWQSYFPKVYGYFYRRLNNKLDVEDLTSITLQQFFVTISDPDKAERVKNQDAYLWKIAHNQLAQFIDRKTKQQITVGLDENLDTINLDLEKHRSTTYLARVESLKKCIAKVLNGQDQQIIMLSLVEDLKSHEVGQELNIKPDNVRQRLSRGLKKVRDKCKAVWHS